MAVLGEVRFLVSEVPLYHRLLRHGGPCERTPIVQILRETTQIQDIPHEILILEIHFIHIFT